MLCGIFIICTVFSYIHVVAPEPPKNLEAKFIGNDTMNLQWDIPWKLNIGLKRFIITVDDNIEDETILRAKIQVIEEKPTYNYTVMKYVIINH